MNVVVQWLKLWIKVGCVAIQMKAMLKNTFDAVLYMFALKL